MRQTVTFAIIVFAVACQSAQQDAGAPGTGASSTTYSRGSSTVASSETTRVSTDSAPPARGSVTLTLDRATYAPGATATMRMANGTGDSLGYNPCSSRTVERQQGARWVAHPEPDRMCTMELRLLGPGETQTATTDIPRDLSAGTYRIALRFTREQSGASGSVTAISPTFTVN